MEELRDHQESAAGRPGDQFAQLRNVPLFAGLDDEDAGGLCRLLRMRDYESGEMVFRTGDPGDAMFLVERGRIRISVVDTEGHNVTLAELRPGEFFGEMAMLDGKGRSADATVVQEARLAILTRADFLDFVQSDSTVVLEMLAAMTHRLRHTHDILRHRVSRNVNKEMAANTTLADRAADLIATFGGSWRFIGFSIAFVIVWALVNTYVLKNAGLDPFPYILLNLVLGIIAGLQAPIIMMSQNRQAEKDRLRADLDYQVNLKNELLLTEILRRLEKQEALSDRSIE